MYGASAALMPRNSGWSFILATSGPGGRSASTRCRYRSPNWNRLRLVTPIRPGSSPRSDAAKVSAISGAEPGFIRATMSVRCIGSPPSGAHGRRVLLDLLADPLHLDHRVAVDVV